MKAINKDFAREIAKTRSRFLSILVLAALAVAFLCGLRAIAPDMKHTLDDYMDDHNFMDVQVMSTLGLTEEDIEELSARPGVEEVEASRLLDAYASSDITEIVVKAWNLPESINTLTVTDGRLPENAGECAVDKKLLTDLQVKVGDSIKLRTEGSYEDCLTVSAVKIVGCVNSPYYISVERGSSTLGTGSVSAFLYLHEDAFDMDYYTAAFLRLDGTRDMVAFSDEYEDYIEAFIDDNEGFSDERAALRTAEVKRKANEKVDDAQGELDDAKAEADEKLGDAAQELADANVKIQDGKAELEDAKQTLQTEVAKAEEEIEDADWQLLQLRRQLFEAEDAYNAGLAQYETGKAQWEAQRAGLAASITGLEGDIAGLQAYNASLDPTDATEAAIIAANEGNIAAAQAGIAAYQTGIAQGDAQIEAAYNELLASRAQIDEGWREWRVGTANLDDARQELQEKTAEYEADIADAEKKLKDGERDYQDGLKEYSDAKDEADEKIGDAQDKIDDARRKVRDIRECEWYVLGRESNPGYLGFGQDADRMGNLAKVFPVLFFLVAALVCLTTMTRMVEEQRMQIGSLKALGYSRFAISCKYIGYGALPAFAGGVLGLVIGYTLFPSMIFTAWQIMYVVPDIELRTYPAVSVMCMICIVACTTLSSLWACISTLRATPATLMRPKTPAAGKRVFLEYIKPLWKRISFNGKITARNLFRYKKRFFMTVIGIGGCTALIIAGFGLRSSLLDTMDIQYDQLFSYNAQVTLKNDLVDWEIEDVENYLVGSENVEKFMACRYASVTAESTNYSTSAYMQVCSGEELPDFAVLRRYKDKTPISLDDSGVVIDQKLSELLGLGIGDSFTVDSDGRHSVSVAGITEHYLGHFIYMTPAYYEKQFGRTFEMNSCQLVLSDSGLEACDAVFTDLMKLDGVAATTRMEDTRDTYQHSMERVDFVVVIVILCAAALAVVVLYNLSNINITERLRELATIKVLGFYDSEVSAYIYRENVVLTMIGTGLGIVLGHWLHVWLVRSVEIDLMMFGRHTDPWAYLWAAVITCFFSFLVNFIAHFKMKEIDMVESLKSAE